LQLVEAPDWSNGRDVVTWSKRIFCSYALRTVGSTASPDQAVSAPQPLSTAYL
jgi:hypothetical protein